MHDNMVLTNSVIVSTKIAYVIAPCFFSIDAALNKVTFDNYTV